MTFRVVVTENAKSNLRSYYERAAQEAPETAAAWLTRFESALESLSDNPAKCILAPENELVTEEIRQLFFGKQRRRYRALFTIKDVEVQVLHIRWGAMDMGTKRDLFG